MLTRSARHTIARIGFVTLLFAVVAVLLGTVMGWPRDQIVLTAALLGTGLGAFEELYVQRTIGRRMRAMSPLRSAAIHAVVVVILLVAMHVTHLLLGRLDRLGDAYRRLPIGLPVAYLVSILGILSLRIIGFLGLHNVGALLTGRYQRPVLVRKAFLFVDLRDSTSIAEKLGALEARALIGKFVFDISKPISDHHGEVYVYTGDGLVAMWDWDRAVTDQNIVRAAEGIFQAVEREREAYRSRFGFVPALRIGAHGGDVVLSEQGDARRAIGVYGDGINIAARMEQAAKNRNEMALFSSDLVQPMQRGDSPFEFLGEEPVKGITRPVHVYRLAGTAKDAGAGSSPPAP